MSRSQRDKGSREERAIVRALTDAGLTAQRVPLSGSAGGDFRGDVVLTVNGKPITIEAKIRAGGFRQLYKWIDSADVLTVRSDRNERLYILREQDFLRLISSK